MPAVAGRLFVLRVRNDATPTPAFVAVAGLRARSLALNNELIDVTTADTVGTWREILPAEGVRSMQISASGLAVDKPGLEVVRDAAFDRTLRQCEVVVPNSGTYTGTFMVSSFSLSGGYDNALEFETTLESSGAITFVAEP